jgi:hypothetical protein
VGFHTGIWRIGYEGEWEGSEAFINPNEAVISKVAVEDYTLTKSDV